MQNATSTYLSYTTWIQQIKDTVEALYCEIDLRNYPLEQIYETGMSAEEIAHTIIDEAAYHDQK